MGESQAVLQGLFSPRTAGKLHREPEAQATRFTVQPAAENTHVSPPVLLNPGHL